MIVYGVDPGSEMSAVVVWDHASGKIVGADMIKNEELLASFRALSAALTSGVVLACEYIESMGMPVGATTFTTVRYIGEFKEAFHPHPTVLIPRSAVKLHHCYSRRANDSNIRQAITDRFGPSKLQAFGTKKTPGPLYGITSHKMQALAVALVWSDEHGRGTTGTSGHLDPTPLVRADGARLPTPVSTRPAGTPRTALF